MLKIPMKPVCQKQEKSAVFGDWQQMCCLEKSLHLVNSMHRRALFTRAIHIGLKTSLVEFLGESVVLYLALARCKPQHFAFESVGGMK